jgi:TatA/E family protein of Tat protein translocase
MLSVPHLILLFLIALVVFGPEKLPELARTLSKAMLEFRRATGGLRETLEQEMRQLEREISEKRPPGTGRPALPPAEPQHYSSPEPADSLPEPSSPGHYPPHAEEAAAAAEESPSSEAETAAAAPAHRELAESAAPPPEQEPPSSDTEAEKPTDGHPTAA